MVQRRNGIQESRFIREMEGYLSTQDGEFDNHDLLQIDRFLENTRRLDGDWSGILTALEKNSNFEESADATLKKLRGRLGNTQEKISLFLNEKGIPSPLIIFVGAGGSAPAPTEIPTIQNLLPDLWTQAAAIGSKPLLRLQQQCDALNINNIEDLLTAIFLAQSAVGNSKITALLRSLLEGQATSEDGNPINIRRARRVTERNSPTIEVVESYESRSKRCFPCWWA